MISCRLHIVLTLLLVSCVLEAAEPSRLRAVTSGQGVEILDGNTPVLFFQQAPKAFEGRFERAGYVHPLYDLDGRVISEDFPDDHRHHRGIFWAWHQLIVGGVQIGDPWICRDFLADVKNVEVLPSTGRPPHQSIAIRATVEWNSPKWVDDSGKRKPVVLEETIIRVSESDGLSRSIDFKIQLKAVEAEVSIGGSDDVKGYGGFSPRIRLPDGLKFRAQYGGVEPQTTSVEPSPWLDLTAEYGEDDSLSGVTILCHPTVPGYPQRWILRKKRSMQNPVYPGREAVPLSRDHPLLLRYRLVLHRGAVSDELIEQWFAEYQATK